MNFEKNVKIVLKIPINIIMIVGLPSSTLPAHCLMSSDVKKISFFIRLLNNKLFVSSFFESTE